MAKILKIEVTGLALCYIANNVWNVVLIGDDHHPARVMKGTRPLADLMPTSGVRDANIDLGTTPNSRPTTGADFDKNVIDLSKSYAHGPGKLSVDVKSNARAVHITIPNAKALPGSTMHDKDCYVQEHPGNGSPPVLLDPKSKSVVFEVQVGDDQAATLQVHGVAPIELAGPNETGVAIFLDNDCRGNCRDNDSILIYDWLSSSDGRKFYTGHVFGRGIDFPTLEQIADWALGAKDDRPDATKGIMTARMGNCDPVYFVP